MKQHRNNRFSVLAGALLVLAAASASAAGIDRELAPVDELLADAKARAGASAYLALAPADDPALADAPAWEAPLEGKDASSFLRALQATAPEAVGPLGEMANAVGGRPTLLDREIKLAMGLRAARVARSPYLAAHMARLLGATERGRSLLESERSGDQGGLAPGDRRALDYAEGLSRSPHGVDDALFQQVNAWHDDARLVEMTLCVCFYNFFARFAEALDLPVEPWALEAAPAAKPAPAATFRSSPRTGARGPRIALLSDEEIAAIRATVGDANDPNGSLGRFGLGLPNSIRAMLRAPEVGAAWRGALFAMRDTGRLDKETMAYISNAASAANECYYCELHQVYKLRKLNVPAEKIASLRIDDSALSPARRAATAFARELSLSPWTVDADDVESLKSAFGGEREALEAVVQACAFNFMNRFTDGLGLPSEDGAIQAFDEVDAVAKIPAPSSRVQAGAAR